MTSTDAADRRAALIGAKLGALVREHASVQPERIAGFTGGAGAVVGDTAWVLLEDRPEQGLGSAIAWALRNGATGVHVLAGRATGVLARRVRHFDWPITVSQVDGRSLLPAISAPLDVALPVPESHRALAPMIEAAGARAVEEHGVLAGEVRGLEVCRVVDDPASGEPRLEVGVGTHDREAFHMLHGQMLDEKPIIDALARVVATVAVHRAPGAPQHPLNLLAASRLLRARLLEDPAAIEATSLRAAEPPIARANLKDQAPCVAIAEVDGHDVVVVCTTGVDLDVVPYATDAIAAGNGGRCLVAAPNRDVIDIQRRIAALVRVPTAFVGVEPESR